MNSLLQKIFVILLVLLFSGVVKADDAIKTDNKSKSQDKMRIAVLNLEPKEVSANTADMVSDILRTELLNTGLFRVLERGEMDAILKEQSFQHSGCTETACAVKIGKLLSANKMLVGTVGKIGEKFIISGRIVDVEKGELEFSDNVQVYSEGALVDAAKELAGRLAGRINGDIKTGFRTTKETTAEKKQIGLGDICGQIIRTNGKKCVIDIGSDSGVTTGHLFKIINPIEKEYISEITGEKTSKIESYENIGRIKITAVEPGAASGELQNVTPEKEIMGKQLQFLGIPMLEFTILGVKPLLGINESNGGPDFTIDCKIGQREQGGDWVLRFGYLQTRVVDTKPVPVINYNVKNYSLATGYFYKPFSKEWSFLYAGFLAGYEHCQTDTGNYDKNDNFHIIQSDVGSSSGIGATLVLGAYLPPIPSWPVLLNVELTANHKFMFNSQNINTSAITGNTILPSIIIAFNIGVSIRL